MAEQRPTYLSRARLETALETAEAWAEHGYSQDSRLYWQGMRDTLRVILAKTVQPPMVSTDDPAAFTILTGMSMRYPISN
jgi:hypothetical protein